MVIESLRNEIYRVKNIIISKSTGSIIKRNLVRHIWLRKACAVVVPVIITFCNHYKTAMGSVTDLPMLAIGTDVLSMGFEGYLAYDNSELKSGNPWYENADMETLPVFQNVAVFDYAGYPIGGLSAEEMIQRAEETALTLGLDVDLTYTNPTEEYLQAWREKERSVPGNEGFEPDSTPYEAVAVCGDITIKAEPTGLIRVFFENGVSLPSEYSFPIKEEYYTIHKITQDPVTGEVRSEKEEYLPEGDIRPDYDSETEQAAGTLSYLLSAYPAVVNMDSPAMDLFCDYNIYGQLHITYRAYEGYGDLLERILGYNFNWIKFAPFDAGELWIIDRHKEDLSIKLGDYPIISAEQARALLIQKHYITTVPEEMPGAEYIASVELIYRTGKYNEVFMPYYRFLVELPTMQTNNGLKTFGAYYVPAVDGAYLTNMPLWDGSFN